MTKPDLASLEKTIEKAFDERDGINTATRGESARSRRTVAHSARPR